MRDCKDFFLLKWGTLWIEDYRIEEDLYAIFDAKGALVCFRRKTLEFPEEVLCDGTKSQHDLKGIVLDDFSVNPDNCFYMVKVIVPQPNVPNIIRFYRPWGQEAGFCFTVGLITEVPQPTFCPSTYEGLTIVPRNFLFVREGNEYYHPPSVRQYEFLKAMNHSSVSDDYDYDHVNEYFEE